MIYKVTVCQISYASNDVEIEAESQEQAKEIAMSEAGNHCYYDDAADYEIEAVFSSEELKTLTAKL